MKKYDIFLFDADSTLYDYYKAESYALRTVFKNCGFEYSGRILRKYRKINSKAWADFECGRISKEDLQHIRFARLFDEIGISHDAVDFNKRYLVELGRGAFLIDGAKEICEAVTSAGKQIFIVTNGILATQQSRIKHSIIKNYISDYFVSEFVGHQKPKREYFDYVFAHIPQTPKDKILIIGDSLLADIAGGNAAGIDSCWFNEHSKENETDIIPTYEINKLNELQKFI